MLMMMQVSVIVCVVVSDMTVLAQPEGIRETIVPVVNSQWSGFAFDFGENALF